MQPGTRHRNALTQVTYLCATRTEPRRRCWQRKTTTERGWRGSTRRRTSPPRTWRTRKMPANRNTNIRVSTRDFSARLQSFLSVPYCMAERGGESEIWNVILFQNTSECWHHDTKKNDYPPGSQSRCAKVSFWAEKDSKNLCKQRIWRWAAQH